tara:strand:- start:201 stop:479 length:279 start_codon:yes stop_codon:yes gene_type:complete
MNLIGALQIQHHSNSSRIGLTENLALHSAIDEYYYLQKLASTINDTEARNFILSTAQKLLEKSYGEFKQQSKITNRFIEKVNENKANNFPGK